MLHGFEFFHCSPNALRWDLRQHPHADRSQYIFEVMHALQRDKAHRHDLLVRTAAAKHDFRVLDPRADLDFLFATEPCLASADPPCEVDALTFIGVED